MNQQDEFHCWLALAMLPQASSQFWQRVLDHWADPAEILQASAATLKALGLKESGQAAALAWQRQKQGHPFMQRVARAAAVCQELQVELLAWTDPRYPVGLRQIHGPPIALFVRGNIDCLGLPQLAIVGSRGASRDGLSNARQFARAVVARDLVVTSGLALGVDGAAHEGALAGGGKTVAVMGTGIDRLYPAQHRDLAGQIIASGGALVAELPPGTPPRSWHFPRRNRIISGLARGVLVVEASLASGSLITARLALEQGREVLAIPGSIHNPQARGCHRLIREGARLVETMDDILEELGPWDSPDAGVEPRVSRWPESVVAGEAAAEAVAAPAPVEPEPEPEPEPEGPAGQVWLQLGFDPRDTDDLAAQTGLHAGPLLQALLELELGGYIESVPGGYRRIAPAAEV